MKDRSVAEFLAQFDGDPVAAVHAIRDYIHADTNPTPRTTAPDTPVMIRVDDLHKSYKVGKQRVQALSGASLNIHKGEFIALTGSSGSGKSTLLQLIGGLDKPSTGKVVVDGVDLATLSDARLSEFRGSTIGFVFQFFYLQPFLRLTKNIEVPGMFAHTDRHQRSQDALRLLQKVGLEDRAAHYPREISGGQMQRAAIARALLNKPQILLADEPTGNLDSTNAHAIMKLFTEIRTQYGTTIVIVTHDPAIAAYADREVRVVDGAIQL